MMSWKLAGRALLALSIAAVATMSSAQEDAAQRLVRIFVVEATEGLPPFIVDAADTCFVAAVLALPPDDRLIIAEAPDFISGVNRLVARKPEVAATLFPILDGCGGTIGAGAVMWDWVETAHAGVTEAERVALGTCLIGAIDRLVLDAKRGISRFSFGDFADSIRAMQRERPDLAGTMIADMATCGVTL